MNGELDCFICALGDCLRHWCSTQISAFSIDWVHVVAIPNRELIVACVVHQSGVGES